MEKRNKEPKENSTKKHRRKKRDKIPYFKTYEDKMRDYSSRYLIMYSK